MLNSIVLVGRFTADPELRTTTSGLSVCTFSIAVDRPYTAASKERKTDFIKIQTWRQNADFVCKYFRKGSVIAVQGSLQINEYTDRNGIKKTEPLVIANSVSSCGAKNTPSDNTSAVPAIPAQPAVSQQTSIPDILTPDFDEDDLPF